MPGPTGAFIIYSLTVWFLITSFRLDISEEKDWMIGTKYKQLFISNKHKQFDWRSFQLQASRAITLKMRDFSFASVRLVEGPSVRGPQTQALKLHVSVWVLSLGQERQNRGMFFQNSVILQEGRQGQGQEIPSHLQERHEIEFKLAWRES